MTINKVKEDIIKNLTEHHDLDNGDLEKALQMPLVFTKRQMIEEVADKWRAQYPDSHQETYNELLKLNSETATPEKIAEIIGNNSWTMLICNQCKRDVEAVVTVGAYPDYETSTACLCIDCIDISREKLLAVSAGKVKPNDFL